MRVSTHGTGGIINTCGDPQRNKKSVDRDVDAFFRRGVDTGHEQERWRVGQKGKRMDVGYVRSRKADRKNI